MARRVVVECCGVCGRPVRQIDDGKVTFLDRVEFVKIEVETVRGGGSWPKYMRGSYENGPGIRLFREDVCGDCYDGIQDLLGPLKEFLHGGGGRQEHSVPPVRDSVVASEGRGASILRALPFVRRAVGQ
jgi:hypothetical protein